MSVFNDNIRFWRQQLGLSQEEFAKMLGIKRGKLSAYEATAEPRTDFYNQIVENYSINLHLFLTKRMTVDNFQSFFTTESDPVSSEKPTGSIKVDEPESALFDLIHKVKNSDTFEERNQLTEKIISKLGKLMEENSALRREMVDLYRKLEKLIYKL